MTAYSPAPRPQFKPTLASLPTLDQYLLLSMLVHVLIILLFGDTGTGVRGGQRIWGAMNVTLQSLLPAHEGSDGPSLRTDTRLASIERGAVRSTAPSAAATPDNTPPETAPRSAIDSRPSESAMSASTPTPAIPETLPAEVPPPAPPAPRFIARDVEKASGNFVVPPAAPVVETPAVKEAPPVDVPAYRAPRLDPVAPLKVEQEIAVPAQLKLRERAAVVPPLAPLAPMTPSPSEREYVPRANALPKLTPIAQPVAAPVVEKIDRQLTAPVAPLPQLAPIAAPPAISTVPARIDRELTTPVAPLPQLAPIEAPPALQAAPARIDRELTAPNPPLPQLTPIAPPAAIATTPAKIDREFVPPPVQAGTSARQDAAPADVRPATTTTADGADRNAPAAKPAGENTPDLTSGRGAARGGDAALPAGTAAPGPKLDLDSIRQRARALAAEGTGPRTVLPFPTAPAPPAKTPMQKAFDKLKRPDCKDAYSSLGLAAVVPLLVDTVREDGCKW